MGWQGRVLRVNLSEGTCEGEDLNREWAEQYLGQRGLGSRYFTAEVEPKVDPLSPDNKLVYATGPLTGTMAPTGARFSVVTKGALTNIIAASNSGGHFGAELKAAGWDVLIVEGKAKSPLYLYVRDDHAELLAADDLWGRSVWECEPALKARHMDPLIKVSSIGRAGEIGVRFAGIVNDLDRAAGRSGVGAVMGSKNLKAIAVRGTTGIAVNDPEAFRAAVDNARRILDPSAPRARYENIGTHGMMDVTQNFGALPAYNCHDVQFDGTPRINAAAMQKRRLTDGRSTLQTNKACFGCTIGCGRVSKLDPTHFSVAGKQGREVYLESQGGLEYESAFSLGAMTGIDDREAMTYANYICNQQGMDPISFGVTVAAAMELYEVGAITDADTGGIALDFGSAEGLVAMAELTALGEGLGKDIGMGSKGLCEKYGHPEFAMQVKGQEIAGYDPRAMQGMGLAYATSNRGACHIRSRPFVDDFSRVETEGKAKIVKDTQDEVAAIDSTGLCVFAYNAWSMDDIAAMVEGACGGGWTAERMCLTGERVWNLERKFNLEAGLTAADDTLPRRLLEEAAKRGTARGHVCGLDAMLPEYYRLRGWDAGGVPTAETVKRLRI